jgi:CRP-like cAMP-binding protein
MQRGVPAAAPHRLADLGPGSFFGEYSVLTGDRTTAAVRALEDTRILALPKQSFERLLQASPAAAETISRVLSERQAQREAVAGAAAESAQALSGDATAVQADEASAPTLLAKIRRFFGLR